PEAGARGAYCRPQAALRNSEPMDATDLSSVLSNSLSSSSILILTALGLAITFGVMRVINMAHGDLLMLGAYTAFVVTEQFKKHCPDYLDYNLAVAIPVSFLVVAFVGYLLEVGLIRFLYGRPLDTLLATWGFGMILQQVIMLVFGSNLQPTHLAESLQGGVKLGSLTIPFYRLFIVGITLFCLLAVYLWFYRTSFGLKVRAVVQNRAMASAMGISTRRVDSVCFAFASGLAGVAGCILAHQFNTKYNMGADYIVDAFMGVILGGMGQLGGSVAGGATIGTGSSVLAKLLGSEWLTKVGLALGLSEEEWSRIVKMNGESLARVLVLLLVIGFIMIRPSGMFAAKERSYE
ncbi:MAG TPA: urea ABC transporter permease subunit UrtB, partial [Gemmataceae bacterium]|nr:urea ABC transporter permease subunit UrtB [Gemmataceae bacterium]